MAATQPDLSSATLTIDEYLHSSYHPDCDFVDDHLEERNLGEFEHSVLQIAMGSWFFAHRAEWNIRVASEYRTRVAKTRVRIPDVSVFHRDGLKEKVRTTPPLLCIEILSPEDRMPRVLKRLDEFLEMGVAHLWLIDPVEREAFVYDRGGLRLADGPRLALPDSPIFVDLPELFSALD
jgi:Uma2 family endonuclease